MRLGIIVSTTLLIIPLTLYGEFYFNKGKITAYDLAELSCQLSCERERAVAAAQAQQGAIVVPFIGTYAMCMRGCVEGIVGREYAAFHESLKSKNDMFMIMLFMGDLDEGFRDSIKDISNYFYSNLPPPLDTTVYK